MKKFLPLIIILALTALATVIFVYSRFGRNNIAPLEADADALGEEEYLVNPEGEADMVYGYYAPIVITSSQARAKMQANPNAIILDVRTQQEFYDERIPGAILLPEYAIRDTAADVLPDKHALILVYCRSGVRSNSAANALVEMGYTNVYDFGGINSWPYERE